MHMRLTDKREYAMFYWVVVAIASGRSIVRLIKILKFDVVILGRFCNVNIWRGNGDW